MTSPGLDVEIWLTVGCLMGGVAFVALSIRHTIAPFGRPINNAMAASAGRVMSCPDGLMSLQLSVSLGASPK